MLPIFTNIPLTLLPAKIYHCHTRGRYLITFIPNNQFLSIRYETHNLQIGVYWPRIEFKYPPLLFILITQTKV